MGQLHTFPTRNPAQLAWEEYARLAKEARTNPMLVENKAHRALRDQAHMRFLSAFNGGDR